MKKIKEANTNEAATKADLHRLADKVEKGFENFGKEIRVEMSKGFEEMARMVSRGFDKMGDEIHEVRDDVKIVKGDIKDLQGRVGNIEHSLLSDNKRITVIEEKIGIER